MRGLQLNAYDKKKKRWNDFCCLQKNKSERPGGRHANKGVMFWSSYTSRENELDGTVISV